MADEVKIIRLVIDSSKAVDGSAAATRALQQMERSTGSMESALARMEASLGKIGGMIKAHLALAVAEAAAHLVQMGREAFAAASGLEELAEQMGITAKGLQALQFTAIQSGASMEQIETAVGKFSQKMGEAADGNKAAIDSLKALGVQNLDLQGKLRPTEDLLVDVAKAITEIDDPARRAAAAVDLFGKGGRALLPSLKDMADGFDTMALRAEAAGAMISAHTIKRLDELADKMEIGKLKTRAFLAEGLVAISDWYAANKDTMMGLPIIGSIITLIENLDKIGPAFRRMSEAAGNAWADIKQAYADGTYEISGAFGRLLDSFSAVGSSIKAIFVGAMNGVIEAIEKGLNSAKDAIAGSWVGKGAATVGLDFGGSVSIPRIGGGGDPSAGPMMTNEQYYRLARGQPRNYRQELDERRAIDFAQWFALQETGSAGYRQSTTGAGTSTPTGGGGGKAEVDEVAKLIEKIAKDAEKARDAFIDATSSLGEQNEVLALELRMVGELPEVRARELAILKTTNEAKKAGIDLNSQEFKDRLAAVDYGERLKAQQQEIAKAQELWTAPLKSALESIQRIGADAFDKFLENGKFSFDELAKVFTTTIRRMIAEFLALATIRPVMSVVVNAISPSIAQSMGLGGGGSSGGGLGGMLGGSGGGGLSLPSWLGGGSISGWLGSPMFGGGAAGPAAGMAPTGASGLTGGGITWGAGLGALAGAGMGVYQLLSGNGSASSTIGGISSIVGAGLSLIPGIGPFLGAGVSLLGNLVPGLLGMDKPPTITNQTYGQLRYGTEGWFTNGGAWGPNANSSDTEKGLAGLGGGISSVFDLLGGVKDPSKVWGLSATNKTVSGQGWSSSSDSTFLVDPSGNQQLWRMNESNMMDTASAQVAYRSILEGAVGTITENMRKAVTQTGQTMGGSSLQSIAETVAEVLAFDDAIKNLGKTVIDAEKAVKAVDDSFAAMYATADKYGLATGELDASKAAARLGVATDFGKSISRGILEMTDPKAAALADLDDWRTMMVDNNKYLLDNVTGALDQIVKIEELYALKRAQIVEDGAKASLTGLADVIKRLTYGDLSGASSADTLAGLQGTYNATLAKANLGDQTAIAGLGGAAADLAQFAGGYYGTATPTYQSLVGGLRGSLANVYTAQGGTDPLIAALTTVSAQFAASEQDNAELKAEMEEVTSAVTTLTEKLQRLLEKMAA